jgi:uncharacterized Zn finger protein
MTASRGYDTEYVPATPLPAPGGIATRSRDGAIGESWWSERFIGLLESFGLGSRLDRGRAYARAGQVIELDVEPGIVLAKVQGSRFTPYRVRIRAATFSEYQWRRAEKAIAARALTLAKLLAGEMPRDIEEVMAACKLRLLPGAYDELRATCTCPDAANPCKHLAAVYYVLAERLDEDPFALFIWHGRTREELLEQLRARRARASAQRASLGGPQPADAPSAEEPAPLSTLLRSFWSAGPELAELHVSPLAAEAPDALLQALGPLAIGSEHGPGLEPAAPKPGGETEGETPPDLAELLAGAYVQLAGAAERRALAE